MSSESPAPEDLHCQIVRVTTISRIHIETHIQHELVVDIGFRNIGVEVRGLNEPQEELVYDLQVRPRYLKHWLVLFRIESIAISVHRGWNRTEKIEGKLQLVIIRLVERTILMTFVYSGSVMTFLLFAT